MRDRVSRPESSKSDDFGRAKIEGPDFVQISGFKEKSDQIREVKELENSGNPKPRVFESSFLEISPGPRETDKSGEN